MDHESTQRLKMDKRLQRRRGWVKPKDYESELESLPDVADKIAPIEPAEPATGERGEA